jgi:hypothetical protein
MWYCCTIGAFEIAQCLPGANVDTKDLVCALMFD